MTWLSKAKTFTKSKKVYGSKNERAAGAEKSLLIKVWVSGIIDNG
jgi:hypothetical protein